MALFPYNHKFGQLIQTDVERHSVDRSFLAHFRVAAADCTAANTNGAMALTNLGAVAASIITGLTNPAVPRNVQIDGNVSGITGNVKVYGTNIANAVISETIALNGTTDVAGALAFKTITKVDLPVQVHTPAEQTETIEITGAPSSDGDITMAITAAILGDASPKAVVVPLTTALNTVTLAAAAIVAALNADEDVSEHFVASNEDGVITLTAKVPLANDTTLAFGFTDTDTTGTTAGSSTNGTTGVPYDKVSVGFGKKFGLPYKLTADELVILKLFDNAVDAGTVTADDDEIEKNVYLVNGTPDGLKPLDLYIIV